ncbi:MAG: SAM hydrolase/SAM-dependent halogenase family protein [Candidatus Helarchaeota archaeon]
MINRIITLLTDFGTSDPYVAIMKGVILSISSNTSIIDITHNIPKFNIIKGALVLLNSGRFFPKDTIHVIVIDPGVGSHRLPILIKTKNYFLIGPDNGVLSLLAYKDGIEKVIALKNTEYFLSKVSMTFHGRDIFAPVAAHLANGIDIEAFGDIIENIQKINDIYFSTGIKKSNDEIICNVIDTDNFGNIITNVPESMIIDTINELKKSGKFKPSNKITIKICKGLKFDSLKQITNIEFPFKKTYSDVEKHNFLSLIGSHGNLEFSKNQGSASESLNISPGEQLILKIIMSKS